MKLRVGFWGLLVVLVALCQAEAQNVLKVCPDPTKPCRSPHKTFAPYELSFQLPTRIKPNTDYKSAPFYAIVCKTLPLGDEDDCTEGEFSAKVEAERRRLQSLVPNRKAFAENMCPDMGAVSYDIKGQTSVAPFVAVYGGTTRREAEQVRTTLKNRYPSATVQQMRVVFQRIVQ